MKKILLNTFAILGFSSAVFSLPGDLDTNFGISGGYIVSDYFSQQVDETPRDVAVQSNGKVIVAGRRSVGVNLFDYLVVRYNDNLNMTLDTSFSDDGIFTLDESGADALNAIAIQSDGKIVAVGAGRIVSQAYVFRLNTDGTLDTTFGIGGIVEVGSAGEALAVAIQPADGKIVLTTANGVNRESIIVRLTTTGALDTSFNSAGLVYLRTTVNHFDPYGLAIQADGKIVISGDTITTRKMATVRLNSNGSFDNTFGTAGFVETDPNLGDSAARSLMIQSDGKIVVGGAPQSSATSLSAAVIRYNSNGSLDTGFDGDGIKTFPRTPGVNNSVNGLVQQSDGKIMMSVAVDSGSTLVERDFSLARLNSDGSFDNSFDGNGLAKSQWCVDIQGFALRNNGSIVAVGRQERPTSTTGESGVCVQKFTQNGLVDATLNLAAGTGQITYKFTSVEAIAGLSDGKTLVAGYESNYDAFGNFVFDRAKLIRLDRFGMLDTTFMDDGVFTCDPVTSVSSYFHGLKVFNDGSFFVVGESGSLDGAVIAKFTSSGGLDNSFSNDGIVNAGLNLKRAYALAVQPDGKILACGSDGSGTAVRSGGIARFSATGVYESSTSTGFGPIAGEIFDCGLQSDGKIIVSGYGNDGVSDFTGVSRLLTTLSLDTSFGLSGVSAIDMSPTLNDRATDMVVQTNDKIVLSTMGLNAANNRDFAVFRLESNGALDTNLAPEFGNNGLSIIDFSLPAPVDDEANAVLVEPTGTIVVAGVSTDAAGSKFALAKLNATGTLRFSWGPFLGRALTTFPNNNATVNALGINFDGKVLAGGKTWNGTRYNWAIARYQNEAAPTAANASLSGRVTTAGGRAISNVMLQLSGGELTEIKYARTNPFGYYSFQDLPVGQSYVLTAASKRFQFSNQSRVVNLDENLTDVDFVSEGKY